MVLTKYSGIGLTLMSISSVLTYFYWKVGISSAMGMAAFLLFLWLVGVLSFARAYAKSPERAGRILAIFGLYATTALMLIVRSNHLSNEAVHSGAGVYLELSTTVFATIFWPSVYRRC